MMDEAGVYAVARSVWGHAEFADEPFTEREAWLWLVGVSPWKDRVQKGNTGRSVMLRRGEFSIAVRYLAEKWKWSGKDRVARFLKRLEKRDMIRDASRDGSQVYSITNYNDFQVVSLPKRDTDATQVATDVRRECDKEEDIKHSISSSLRSEDKPAPKSKAVDPLPDWLDREAWSAFLEMRRKKRKPMTPRAQTLIFGKLDKWRAKGHDPTAILDASTVNAWTDLYESKDEANGRSERAPKQSAHAKFIEGAFLAATEPVAGMAAGGGDDLDQACAALLAPRLRRGAG